MKRVIITITVLLTVLLFVSTQTDNSLKSATNTSIHEMNDEALNVQTLPALKLQYDFPAKSWEKEALPLGNGKIGAMVFGGV